MVPLFCPGCIEIKREIKNREPANLWTSRDELPRLSQDLLQLSQVLWQMFPRNGTLFQICSIILYMHESEINFSSLLQLSQVLWQMLTRNGTLFHIVPMEKGRKSMDHVKYCVLIISHAFSESSSEEWDLISHFPIWPTREVHIDQVKLLHSQNRTSSKNTSASCNTPRLAITRRRSRVGASPLWPWPPP